MMYKKCILVTQKVLSACLSTTSLETYLNTYWAFSQHYTCTLSEFHKCSWMTNTNDSVPIVHGRSRLILYLSWILTHMPVLFMHMLTHICEIICLCIIVTFHVSLILHWLTYTYVWKYLLYFSLHRPGSPTETAGFLCTFGINVINYTKRLL